MSLSVYFAHGYFLFVDFLNNKKKNIGHEFLQTFRVLLLAKGTGVQKSFVIPFFALQAPASIIAWMQ